MTKIRMGSANPITAERFHLIKAAIAEKMPDDTIMAKYEIKKTTLAYVKTSRNFYEYRLRTETLPAARKMPTVIMPSSGLALEDFSCRRKKAPRTKAEIEKQSWQEDMYHNRLVGIVTLAVIGIVGLVAVAVLMSFWNLK